MSTVKCTNLQQASSASPNITLDASTNATVAGTLAMGSSFKRNRIINGNMAIDQRNAGASVTPAQDAFMVDRWKWGQSQSSKFTSIQSTTAPTGYTNSLLMTVAAAVTIGASDYFTVYQPIEGLNVSDLAWGTASASTVTLSFWVRSSLTGTFGGSLRNSAGNRSYPFTYTISSANTFEYKTITISGDTTGTWLTTNGIGIYVQIGLGVGSTLSGTAGSWSANNYLSATGATSVVGTNGATFYITGVQLEVGTVATPYERQIYSDQLAQCQRYLPAFSGTGQLGAGGNASSTTQAYTTIIFPVPARVAATGMTINAASNFVIGCAGVTSDFTCTAVSASNHSTSGSLILSTVSSGLTAGQVITMRGGGSALMYFTGCEL